MLVISDKLQALPSSESLLLLLIPTPTLTQNSSFCFFLGRAAGSDPKWRGPSSNPGPDQRTCRPDIRVDPEAL